MKIYLAGSISGLAYDEVIEKIEYRKMRLGMHFRVFHPMMGKQYLRNETKFKASGYEDFPPSTNHAIFERDRWMVEQCDIILVDLRDATLVSIGSMMEMAWASLLGKLVVTVMEEDNIHQHAFVLEASDVVFEDVDEALDYINKLGRTQRL